MAGDLSWSELRSGSDLFTWFALAETQDIAGVVNVLTVADRW